MIDESYDFYPGRILAKKYEVIERVGESSDGEIYRLHERATGIERTAKFFFPHVDPYNRRMAAHAKRLNKLSHCRILSRYRTQETIQVKGDQVTFFVSDFTSGQLLSDYLAEKPSKRLGEFEALHLIYAITKGVEDLHRLGETHGAIDIDNILVKRQGLGFAVKLLDIPLHTDARNRCERLRDDVCDIIRVFYDLLGGSRYYSKQRREIKSIVCGLRKSLIIEKFRDAGKLRMHLEGLDWQ